MKKILIILSVIIGVFSFSGCQTEDYNPYGDVRGVVLDSTSDLPLANATVYIHEASITVMTDNLGAFSVNNLKGGNYTLLVQKAGYQSNHQTISVKRGEEISVVVKITPMPNF